MSNVFHLVSKYGFCFMNPVLSLGKESLKRIRFVGEQGQGYSIFTPTLGLGSTDLGTSHFQYRLAHQLWVLLPRVKPRYWRWVSDNVFLSLSFQLGF